ncbi:E3 ubiquitin-protein ligase UHRF1-like isoform X3 [Dinothrombium tinctorium]|uniref:RING-type E3 ubiquitin transferase n=1 Tax=Dinothrombium tinctorium TaxID=1965070 RepID=A0A3S3RPA3_9ACAR|nr:E3 ubiquitin-protein ligase UHRF1-like isoform X3 [Dinothrombium tinctorium]
MFVKVTTYISGANHTISIRCKSINDTVASVKESVAREFNVNKREQIRLFYDGKELKNEITLFEYGVRLNNVLQLLIRENVENKESKADEFNDIAEVVTNLDKKLNENEHSLQPLHSIIDESEEAIECNKCNDNPEVRCRQCSCIECGGKDSADKQLLCDECNVIYHIWCLPIPLEEVPPPDEDWYCPECRNEDKQVIERKELLHLEKKKVNKKAKGEWGRGLSCVGRTKVADFVKKDHFGPIPGVDVGTWWRFRFQASEAGVHTPLVAGIHGKENLGAYSIVFCCSYDEDIDLGSEIYFSGSGGKGEGQSRCRVGGPQVKDQELKRCNKALAMNCFAPIDEIKGANAGKDWKLGKPVRVLRSGNARGSTKRSLYLPKIGVRYDGIYKVVKYWPEQNDSGFKVWRFHLRRDDSAPSPWTKEGKLWSRRLGLKLIYPEGWSENKRSSRKSEKRKSDDSTCSDEKRKKVAFFNVSENCKRLIEKDVKNRNLWQSLLNTRSEKSSFQQNVFEAFKCAYCLSLVKEPITTFCCHNICKICFEESLKRCVQTCPVCRKKFKKGGKLPKTNTILSTILSELLI